MTTAQVKEKADSKERAGTHLLSLLAVPVNVFVLQALAEKPRSLVDLRREVGSPPQTTMRRQLRVLTDMGVLAKRRQSAFPGSLEYALTTAGTELLTVAGIISSWLAASPEGPLSLGSVAAKSAINSLVEGWETNMLRALAAKPFSLTELDNLISTLSYPSLERRLAAMRLAGQVEALPSRGRGTPYAVTGWLRCGVGPLAAAARWELLHLDGHATARGRDAEASLLLAVPLLRLPADLSGSCRLAVEVENGGRYRLAGVMVAVEGGRVVSCSTRLEGHPDAWVVAPTGAWLNAVIDFDTGRLEVGGDSALATGLLEGLHGSLFRGAASLGNGMGPELP